MSSLSQVVSPLHHAREMLEPIVASLHRQDSSELFLSVGPGIGEEVYGLIHQAALQLVTRNWVAGRRGRITCSLIEALGELQQAQRATNRTVCTRHTETAGQRLLHALAEISRLSARRSSR